MTTDYPDIIQAIQNNDALQVQRALQQRPPPILHPCMLHYAVCNDNLFIVQLLVEVGKMDPCIKWKGILPTDPKICTHPQIRKYLKSKRPKISLDDKVYIFVI